jgi:hypothetical protein
MTTLQTDSLEAIIQDLKQLGERARSLLNSPDLDLQTKRQTSDRYQSELVQVAASAIAALQNYTKRPPLMIWQQVIKERKRQDQKFGAAVDRDLDPLVWMVVILEELAESAQEVNINE